MIIKKLDLYITRKFLGTFFFSLALILCIVVVFDISEKLERFLEYKAPVKAIIVDYYFNFLPYFANVFSSLFTFIAVIFFTSKMASDSEIIAILSTGISFRRLLVPYLFSATVIACLSFLMGAYIIPNANQKRIRIKNNISIAKSHPERSFICRLIRLLPISVMIFLWKIFMGIHW